MIVKKFEYKGQYLNYWNKMKNNNKIEFSVGGWDSSYGAYVIKYRYKNN